MKLKSPDAQHSTSPFESDSRLTGLIESRLRAVSRLAFRLAS